MTKHGSASPRKQESRTLNADLKRRARKLTTDSRVDPRTRSLIGYGLEIKDQYLERIEIILSEYCRALTEVTGAKYIIPFRVEHEDSRKASHYLIHATKHPLGFRIMKDVMWARGHAEDQPGALQLRQKGRTNFIPMFDKYTDIKEEILEALKTEPLRVSVFYTEWTMRPNDMQCEAAYRKALLELESNGKIEVLGKDGKNVTGVESRPKRKGKPTLAKDYYVRLKTDLFIRDR